MNGQGKLIYVTAGEPSGDQIGARLMAALQEESEVPLTFAGVGGPRMEAAGLTSLFPMSELSVMGLDFIPSARRILARIRQTVDDVVVRSPAALVTIDAQGFSARLGRQVRLKADLPIIHYGAPTVWAYRAGRAAKVSEYLDRLLCIFPFEPPLFAPYDLEATFVGHSAAEARFMAPADGPALRRRLGIARDAPVLATLPGSRRGEIRRLAAVFGGVISAIHRETPDLHCLLPTVPAVADQVADGVRNWPTPVHILQEPDEKYAAFAAADAALATSGTVTVETSFAGLPTVVVYRASTTVAWIVRTLGILKIKYASGTNLILDRMALPEFIQWDATVDKILPALRPLLTDTPQRRQMLQDMTEATDKLVAGNDPPRVAAARAIIDEMTRYPKGRRAAGNASKEMRHG